ITELLNKCQCVEVSALENSPFGHIYLDKSLSVDLSSTNLRNQLRDPGSQTTAFDQIPSHALEIITNLGLYK
ncbi:MAG: nicotinate-nicotinamide nucleotide adenylyltransferase, partial [Polynucleobacter sp. 24-46-87]